MRAHLFAAFALAAAACATDSIGDPHLAYMPNLLVEADPLQLIREQSVAPHIPTCDAPTTEIGPSSNIPVSEVEYPSYNQEGRTTHVVNMPFSFGMKIATGPHRGKYLRVTVPPGFVTDFHSVPLSLTGQASSLRKALAAAAVHDWMFAVGSEVWQRDLANLAFDEIAKFYAVDSGTRGKAQFGFETFGNASFGKPDELRFYNKCFYRGLCDADLLAARPDLKAGPVIPMPSTGEHASLRAGLWAATVCLRDFAPGTGRQDSAGQPVAR